MSTAFVDVKWGLAADRVEDHADAGWVRYSGTRDYPSPRMLSAAQALAARGEPISYHYLSLEAAGPDLDDALTGSQRVVIAAPPIHRHLSRRLRQRLIERGASDAAVTLFDPWAPPGELAIGGPGYALAADQVTGHAEVDVAPYRDPVHPWVCPIGDDHAAPDWEARLLAAVASFAPVDPEQRARAVWQAWERDLFLNDPRVPTTMDRLRAVARALSGGLREHSTMLKLHLRVWPSDLADDRPLVDHLTLLPIGSLDLLAGSVDHEVDLPGACAPDVLRRALLHLRDGGMSHVTGLSVVLALPGQDPQECLATIKRALTLASEAKVRRVRFAFWLGAAARSPESADDQHRMFFDSHPDWHAVEYAGVGDFVALMRQAARGIEVVGPEIAPGWEPLRVADDAAG